LLYLKFPTSIRTIDEYAFLDCKGLKSIEINEGLTEISAGAFYGCNSTETIYLPSTLQTIGKDAFYSNTKLTAIYCNAVTPPACGNANIFRYLDTKQCTLYVPEGSVDAYRQANVWKNFFNIEAAGISSPVLEDTIISIYAPDGRRLLTQRKGLNIMRTSDGRKLKVMIK